MRESAKKVHFLGKLAATMQGNRWNSAEAENQRHNQLFARQFINFLEKLVSSLSQAGMTWPSIQPDSSVNDVTRGSLSGQKRPT